ncbi:hypothetical protein S245_061900, partial [Arachis hypogaea]
SFTCFNVTCYPSSYLLNRPVRLTLDRDFDMMITGQRHSFLGKYKAENDYEL